MTVGFSRNFNMVFYGFFGGHARKKTPQVYELHLRGLVLRPTGMSETNRINLTGKANSQKNVYLLLICLLALLRQCFDVTIFTKLACELNCSEKHLLLD